MGDATLIEHVHTLVLEYLTNYCGVQERQMLAVVAGTVYTKASQQLMSKPRPLGGADTCA